MNHGTPSFVSSLLLVLTLLLALGGLTACGGGGGTGGSTDPIRDAVQPPPSEVMPLGPGAGITFQQVDLVAGEDPHVDSTWGRMLIEPQILGENAGREGGYVNLVTDLGWACVNVPVPPPSEPPLAVYFDLGVDDGTWLEALPVHVTYSAEPVGDITAWLEAPHVYDLGRWIWNAEDVAATEVLEIGPAPRTVPLGEVVRVGQETFAHYQQVTNVQCAENQCYPMAIANALQFLENRGHLNIPHPHQLGLKGDKTLVGMLDTASGRTVTSRTSGYGVWFRPMIEGLFSYLKDQKLDGILSHRHQDRGYGKLFPSGNYTYDGSTTTTDGARATWAWIDRRLQDGCGIVAVYESTTAAHAVRITGAGRANGQPWIRYSHDATQSGWDTKDVLGLEDVLVFLVDLDQDGILNFGSAGRELMFVEAHCP